MVIEITKDIFPDDKKYKKVQESGLKTLFLHFLALWPKDFAQFSPPMCAIWWVL